MKDYSFLWMKELKKELKEKQNEFRHNNKGRK